MVIDKMKHEKGFGLIILLIVLVGSSFYLLEMFKRDQVNSQKEQIHNIETNVNRIIGYMRDYETMKMKEILSTSKSISRDQMENNVLISDIKQLSQLDALSKCNTAQVGNDENLNGCPSLTSTLIGSVSVYPYRLIAAKDPLYLALYKNIEIDKRPLYSELRIDVTDLHNYKFASSLNNSNRNYQLKSKAFWTGLLGKFPRSRIVKSNTGKWFLAIPIYPIMPKDQQASPLAILKQDGSTPIVNDSHEWSISGEHGSSNKLAVNNGAIDLAGNSQISISTENIPIAMGISMVGYTDDEIHNLEQITKDPKKYKDDRYNSGTPKLGIFQDMYGDNTGAYGMDGSYDASMKLSKVPFSTKWCEPSIPAKGVQTSDLNINTMIVALYNKSDEINLNRITRSITAFTVLPRVVSNESSNSNDSKYLTFSFMLYGRGLNNEALRLGSSIKELDEYDAKIRNNNYFDGKNPYYETSVRGLVGYTVTCKKYRK